MTKMLLRRMVAYCGARGSAVASVHAGVSRTHAWAVKSSAWLVAALDIER